MKETKEFKFNCEYMFHVESQKTIYNYTIYLGKNDNDQYEIKYEKLMQKNGNYPNNNYKTIFECRNGEIENIELENADKDYVVKKTMNLLSSKSLVYLLIANLKKDAAKAKITTETKGKKKTYVTSDMSKLTRNERKIVGKIMTIITDIAPKDVAEEIIAKIKKEMR